jgi:hypothetical protein
VKKIIFILPFAREMLSESITNGHYGAYLVRDGIGGSCVAKLLYTKPKALV